MVPTPPEITGEPAVAAAGLVKRFGATRAVDGVDLVVPRGQVYGVLGPNGAGKTTTIRMLATLLRPDAGTARVLGHDIVEEAAAVRAKVSLTGQFASLDEDLTAAENLVLLGRLLGHRPRAARQRCTELLAAFDIEAAADRPVAQFSGGMRRRLDIAAGLIVIPELMFLDEPTTGLDPRSRNGVWEIVRAVVGRGTTVVLTTQYLDEADQLADRIAVIDHGRVIAEGTPAELKSSTGAGALRIRLGDPARRDEAVRLLAERLAVQITAGTDPLTLTARLPAAEREHDAAALAARALADLAGCAIPVSDFAIGQPSLDEVFLALTGSPATAQDRTDEIEAVA